MSALPSNSHSNSSCDPGLTSPISVPASKPVSAFELPGNHNQVTLTKDSTSSRDLELVGSWHSYGLGNSGYNDITFHSDGTYSFSYIHLRCAERRPPNAEEIGDGAYISTRSDSVPTGSYPPEMLAHLFGRWRVMSNDEWKQWIKDKKRSDLKRRNFPRLCIRTGPSNMTLSTYLQSAESQYTCKCSRSGLGPQTFILSRQGIELYCVDGGVNVLFRRGALPRCEAMPLTAPFEYHKWTDVI